MQHPKSKEGPVGASPPHGQRRPAASRDYHAHEDTMSCFYRLAEDGRISLWLRCFPDTTNRLNNNSRANKNPSKIGKPNLGIIVARIRDATTL